MLDYPGSPRLRGLWNYFYINALSHHYHARLTLASHSTAGKCFLCKFFTSFFHWKVINFYGQLEVFINALDENGDYEFCEGWNAWLVEFCWGSLRREQIQIKFSWSCCNFWSISLETSIDWLIIDNSFKVFSIFSQKFNCNLFSPTFVPSVQSIWCSPQLLIKSCKNPWKSLDELSTRKASLETFLLWSFSINNLLSKRAKVDEYPRTKTDSSMQRMLENWISNCFTASLGGRKTCEELFTFHLSSIN